MIVLLLTKLNLSYASDHLHLLKINKTKFHVEIASTKTQRQKGLMHRNFLKKNDGMLFIFPTNRFVKMWMKNTFIPLSVAFIDQNGFIKQIIQMQPESTLIHTSKNKVKYALEMNLGWFKKNNISIVTN